MKENKEPEKQTSYLALGMCIGVSIGTAIGAALGNISIGMCFGLSIGMGIGACIDYHLAEKHKKEEEKADGGGNLSEAVGESAENTEKITENAEEKDE